MWNAVKCHRVARVHATKASPILATADGPRQPSNDTMQPSWAVMPWHLWMVRAHARRKGKPVRVTAFMLLCCTPTQGTGTQVLGRPGKHAGPLYCGKWTTTKSGRGHWSGPRGNAPGVELGCPAPAIARPSARAPASGAYRMATTTPRAPFISPRVTVGTPQMWFCVSRTRAPTRKCRARRTCMKSSAVLCKPRGSLWRASALTTTPSALAAPGATPGSCSGATPASPAARGGLAGPGAAPGSCGAVVLAPLSACGCPCRGALAASCFPFTFPAAAFSGTTTTASRVKSPPPSHGHGVSQSSESSSCVFQRS